MSSLSPSSSSIHVPDIGIYESFAANGTHSDDSIITNVHEGVITAVPVQESRISINSQEASQKRVEIVDHFREALRQKYGAETRDVAFNGILQAQACTSGLKKSQVRSVLNAAAREPSRMEEVKNSAERIRDIRDCNNEIIKEKKWLHNEQNQLGVERVISHEGNSLFKILKLQLHLLNLISRSSEVEQNSFLAGAGHVFDKKPLAEKTVKSLVKAAHFFVKAAEEIEHSINLERDAITGKSKNSSDLDYYIHRAKEVVALFGSEDFIRLVLPHLGKKDEEDLFETMRQVRQELHEIRDRLQSDHPALARRAELLRQKPVPTKPISSLSNASAGGGSRAAAVISSQVPITEEEKEAALKTAHDAILVQLDAQKIKNQEEAAKLKNAKQRIAWGF